VAKNHPSKNSGFPGEPALLKDTQAYKGTLDELGWANGSADDFDQQRAYLQQHNGIKGLERLQPSDVEDAVRIFYRDGFVVIENALNSDQLAELVIATPSAPPVLPVNCCTNLLGPSWPICQRSRPLSRRYSAAETTYCAGLAATSVCPEPAVISPCIRI
jgi:hypothetical protein